MATLTVPSFGFQNASWVRERDDRRMRTLSGNPVIVRGRVDDFAQQITLAPIRDEARARVIWRWLLQAADLGNNFLLGPPDFKGTGTAYAGAEPKVKGGSQTGYTLACDNVSAGAAILADGAYVAIGGKINMVTADVTADGSGNISLPLLKPIQAGDSPADNLTVSIFAPKSYYRMQESVARLTLDRIKTHGFSFTAVED